MPELKAKLPLFAALALFLILFPGACLASRHRKDDCGSTFCGNLNISYPFRLKTQPPHCGYQWLELDCENNNRTLLVTKTGKFSVKEISYENHTMRVVDASLDRDNHEYCNSLPLSSLPYCERYGQFQLSSARVADDRFSVMYLVNCSRPTESPLYVDASRCANNYSSPSRRYFYFLNMSILPSDFNQFCTVEAKVPITVTSISGMSTLDVYHKLSKGFLLSWASYHFTSSYVQLQINHILILNV